MSWKILIIGHVCVLSFLVVSDSATLQTVAHQSPLSMVSSRQEYWSRLLCPPPGKSSQPNIKPVSHVSFALAGRFFTTSITWEAHYSIYGGFLQLLLNHFQ